jgi:hypothetical protein
LAEIITAESCQKNCYLPAPPGLYGTNWKKEIETIPDSPFTIHDSPFTIHHLSFANVTSLTLDLSRFTFQHKYIPAYLAGCYKHPH